MSSNAATDMAIEAFRHHERARRLFYKSEDGVRKALSRVPSDQMDRYFLSTEVIRLEEERKESREVNDAESVIWCSERIAELQRTIRERFHD